jgi:hypothetical protein
MNRRGIFVTLTACLILLILVVLLIVNSERKSRASDVEAQYLKHKAIADYGKDIETFYLPPLIAQAEKHAFLGISQRVSTTGSTVSIESALEEVVNTGKLAGVMVSSITLTDLVNQTSDTLIVPLEIDNFQYEVTSIRHLNATHMLITSRVQYDLDATSSVWHDVSEIKLSYDRSYQSIITVYGLHHPVYSSRVITRIWPVSATDCVLKALDPSVDCDGAPGLCPLGSCV